MLKQINKQKTAENLLDLISKSGKIARLQDPYFKR